MFMNFIKLTAKSLISAAVLSGCVFTSIQALTWAGGNPGLTIFSGVDRKDILDYYLQFGGRPHNIDRYKLYVPPKKLTQGASTFFISYPDYYNGEFDLKKIEVRVKGKPLPLKEVVWDKESRLVEISLETPVEPNTRTEIVMSNVKNPDLGTYYFVCDVLASGDIPVRLYIGTWIISIEPQ